MNNTIFELLSLVVIFIYYLLLIAMYFEIVKMILTEFKFVCMNITS